MSHIKNALIRYRIIDKALRNPYKPYPSKADLRHACEETLYGDSFGEHICDSTIEKDMFAMKMEHDAPIKYSRRHSGYYYTDKDFSINEIPLSPDDIESLKFAANTLAQFKDASIFKQFGFALNKIVDRVQTSDSPEIETDQFIQFESGTTAIGNEFLAPLLDAINNRFIVYFYYQSFVSGERKKRKVTPLLLKEYRNRWYLISYDLIKESIITYALDRMDELDCSNQKGFYPKNFNPDLFFKHAIGITTGKKQPEKVIFEADTVAAKYIESQPFHTSQKVVDKNAHTKRFELYVIISEELIRTLLSFGGEIKIVQPESLKNEILSRLKKSIALHKNPRP